MSFACLNFFKTNNLFKELAHSCQLFLPIASFFLLSSCYSLQLAFEQNNLFNARIPINQQLKEQSLTNPEQGKKLAFVKKILQFATEEGLNTKNAYRFYIANNRDAFSYSLQASHPRRLEFIYWWFPFVGSVPYLGFFHRTDRDQMAQQLTNQGFDVARFQVAAYSSLGWFEDPIYESMLDGTYSDLAEVLFHELTHRTLWISGESIFNENLATFVGETLTIAFLNKFKLQSELKQYQLERQDKLRYEAWLSSFKKELDTFYSNLEIEVLTDADFKNKKDQIFLKFLSNKKPHFFTLDPKHFQTTAWNNATVLGKSMYAPDIKAFERVFECASSKKMGDFLASLRQAYKKFTNPTQALDHLCQRSAYDLSTKQASS